MMMEKAKYLSAFGIAAAVTLPGLWVRLFHMEFAPPVMVFLSGMAIIGGSFLLLWACDAAQADVSQTLALAVVALIAVLPEYAVDMYFTWQAGQYPEGSYAHYSIANMTGANRLLIGVAWAMIAVICWVKTRSAVQLEGERRTEILFLGMATAYAFAVPVKGTLEWYDGIVFIGLYIWYITLASRRPCTECEPEGPSILLTRLPKAKRRLLTVLTFAFSGGVILANAEPFSEGLIATGRLWGINEFLLVQWLAPIASEAPEFIVAGMFAFRGQAGVALGSLLSAKLNQWTLLVGMIPGVYGLSRMSLANPIPLDRFQLEEILLTAAQSMLAVVLLAGLRLSIAGAALLFVLFVGQFVTPVLGEMLWGILPGAPGIGRIHHVFSVLYVFLAICLIIAHPKRMLSLRQGLRIEKTGAPLLNGSICEKP